MVLVTSTFKLSNGMEAAVRRAFLDRPGLPDAAPGFLGMEVLGDIQENSTFHLLTRWTDQASFESWQLRPLPEGVELNASHTILGTFDSLPGEALIARLPRFLARSSSLHWMKAGFDGRIVAANPAFELLLQEPAGVLAGQSLWDRMTQPDGATTRAILQSADPDSGLPVLLNFVDRHQCVHTLECHLEVHRDGFVLVGEPLREDERALAKELLELNNRWALLVRDNEKNIKALRQAHEQLEKALVELKQSHWHLRKIQETLPICMYCGKVKTGEARWEGVVEYLKANSLFLSHGCCPACLPRMDGPAEAE